MGWLVHAMLQPLYPPHPLYRKLGGPQGWSGGCGKSHPPLGFDPWTIQPVVSWFCLGASPNIKDCDWGGGIIIYLGKYYM